MSALVVVVLSQSLEDDDPSFNGDDSVDRELIEGRVGARGFLGLISSMEEARRIMPGREDFAVAGAICLDVSSPGAEGGGSRSRDDGKYD